MPFGRVDLEKDVAGAGWYAQEAYERIPDLPYDRGDAEMRDLDNVPNPDVSGDI
ncbi:hypothetical protein ASPVEDRAFT_82354 [Aspergillus versicolor CBS 583.65]|uniref:Uncharacterized protein n=1 Tax=Aspergillus versicolor CBS 583.65 TaxID=1036611 RepID=A0A1L9PH09_ASPVE|nr:uncharacterized protein ASPVEDRAFT_82354 [Aspergillus versicolor CBS 583.65]OJJ00798.1 hypothetical protein ASPVEDRAFT_82354 [Aspergillus versicolor CBS 583.65]